MTGLSKSFYVNTGRDGILGDTTPSDIKDLIEGLRDHQRVVLHFHGGLVSKKQGLEEAANLKKIYVDAGAHPVFFIWESDLLATLGHNLHEINKEKVLKQLLAIITKFAVGKLLDIDGGKATGKLQLPNNIELGIELKRAELGEEPYSELLPSDNLQELNSAELSEFENTLVRDASFQRTVQEIIASAVPENEARESSSKGVLSVDRRSGTTLMSPDVLDELREDFAKSEGKGLISSALLVKRAGQILTRVIRRFIEKRDHGVYCTVVEEILRDLYIANIGGGIWAMMKKETADAFELAGQEPVRGGWFFVKELSDLIASGHRPEITLVGHSAGGIYICNLLRYIADRRRGSDQPILGDFKFKNVVLLAPGCDFTLFDAVVQGFGQTFEHFRMFALSDEGESGEPMIPVLYPRSLLYFVSGVLEKRADDPDKGAYDRPLVGMQRYYTNSQTYQGTAVQAARRFVNTDSRRAVWAVEDRGPGLVSSASAHGAFIEEADTLASVGHIIRQGWDR